MVRQGKALDTTQTRALRKYIADGSGIASTHCIPASDGYPLPDGLFAAVLVQDTDAEGSTPNFHWDSDTEIQTQAEYRAAIVQIQWYRAGATDAAHLFHSWCVSDLGVIEADVIKMRFHPSTIRDVSAIITDDWEQRCEMTLTVAYRRETEQTIRRIEELSGGGVGVYHEG